MFRTIDFMIEGLEYFCQKVKLSTNIKRHNSNIVKYNLFDCLAENHNGKLSKKSTATAENCQTEKNDLQPQ